MIRARAALTVEALEDRFSTLVTLPEPVRLPVSLGANRCRAPEPRRNLVQSRSEPVLVRTGLGPLCVFDEVFDVG